MKRNVCIHICIQFCSIFLQSIFVALLVLFFFSPLEEFIFPSLHSYRWISRFGIDGIEIEIRNLEFISVRLVTSLKLYNLWNLFYWFFHITTRETDIRMLKNSLNLAFLQLYTSSGYAIGITVFSSCFRSFANFFLNSFRNYKYTLESRKLISLPQPWMSSKITHNLQACYYGITFAMLTCKAALPINLLAVLGRNTHVLPV